VDSDLGSAFGDSFLGADASSRTGAAGALVDFGSAAGLGDSAGAAADAPVVFAATLRGRGFGLASDAEAGPKSNSGPSSDLVARFRGPRGVFFSFLERDRGALAGSELLAAPWAPAAGDESSSISRESV
jgi:hypothetical protein